MVKFFFWKPITSSVMAITGNFSTPGKNCAIDKVDPKKGTTGGPKFEYFFPSKFYANLEGNLCLFSPGGAFSQAPLRLSAIILKTSAATAAAARAAAR